RRSQTRRVVRTLARAAPRDSSPPASTSPSPHLKHRLAGVRFGGGRRRCRKLNAGRPVAGRYLGSRDVRARDATEETAEQTRPFEFGALRVAGVRRKPRLPHARNPFIEALAQEVHASRTLQSKPRSRTHRG